MVWSKIVKNLLDISNIISLFNDVLVVFLLFVSNQLLKLAVMKRQNSIKVHEVLS